MGSKNPKIDFLFIDESGDPGIRGTNYYTCCVLHVTDISLHEVVQKISEFRFYFDHYHEIHSHKLSKNRLRKLNQLLRKKKRHFKSSVVTLDKKNYKGFYLKDRGLKKADSNLFRKYIYRQVVDFHFLNHKIETKRVELVLDRANLSSEDMDNLEGYLRRWSLLPRLDALTEVDSKYTDCIQVADVIASCFRPEILEDKYSGFSHKIADHKDITFENAKGEKY